MSYSVFSELVGAITDYQNLKVVFNNILVFLVIVSDNQYFLVDSCDLLVMYIKKEKVDKQQRKICQQIFIYMCHHLALRGLSSSGNKENFKWLLQEQQHFKVENFSSGLIYVLLVPIRVYRILDDYMLLVAGFIV